MWAISEGEGAPASRAVSSYRSGSFHRLMSGNIISAILEKGQGFPEAGPLPTFWPLMAGLSAGGCVTEMLIYYGEPIIRLPSHWRLNLLLSWT